MLIWFCHRTTLESWKLYVYRRAGSSTAAFAKFRELDPVTDHLTQRSTSEINKYSLSVRMVILMMKQTWVDGWKQIISTLNTLIIYILLLLGRPLYWNLSTENFIDRGPSSYILIQSYHLSLFYSYLHHNSCSVNSIKSSDLPFLQFNYEMHEMSLNLFIIWLNLRL